MISASKTSIETGKRHSKELIEEVAVQATSQTSLPVLAHLQEIKEDDMDILDLVMAVCLAGIIAIVGLFSVGMLIAWCVDKVQGR